jgi:trans-L-3-hydroxyproline dehydratase|tara:strand:- start:1445 stop:2452 length:1008 start_codon:yes stop_codon:yes gene_type:complete
MKIKTIEAHTGGEPLRIIIDGYPKLKGKTLLEKRNDALLNHDHIRKAIIWEPRGHANMYGAILVEPDSPEADIGVIFMHNEGYSTGCGHAVIALTKVLIEMGFMQMVEPETTVKMDVPSGYIESFARINDGNVKDVRFQNVPSFVQSLDATIDIPDIGIIDYDLAFGGAYYAIVNVNQVNLKCIEKYHDALINKGMRIKHAIMNSVEIKHPIEPEMNFLYGTIFTDLAQDSTNHSRNVCIFADGELDRSPTGTGVSARAAIHYKRNEIKLGESITIESILGSSFSVRIDRAIEYGKYNAIIPEVTGDAYITGMNTFFINPNDPLKDGFIFNKELI